MHNVTIRGKNHLASLGSFSSWFLPAVVVAEVVAPPQLVWRQAAVVAVGLELLRGFLFQQHSAQMSLAYRLEMAGRLAPAGLVQLMVRLVAPAAALS